MGGLTDGWGRGLRGKGRPRSLQPTAITPIPTHPKREVCLTPSRTLRGKYAEMPMKSSPENSDRTADLSNAGVPSGAFLRAG